MRLKTTSYKKNKKGGLTKSTTSAIIKTVKGKRGKQNEISISKSFR